MNYLRPAIIALLAALAVGVSLVSGGSTAVLVKDILPGGLGSAPAELTDVNGTLFFTADDGVSRRELWKSDGTEAGTVLVRDLGGGNTLVQHLTDVNGILFFAAHTSDVELWRSDGTESGTFMVKNIRPEGISLPRSLTDVNGTLFFTAFESVHGRELWKAEPGAAPPTATATTTQTSPGPTATPTATSPGPATPTPTSPAPGTPTPAGGLPGDVGCDGTVSSLDALALLQFSAGLVGSLPCQQNADVNGDGNIDSLDAVLILQFVAGLIPSL